MTPTNALPILESVSAAQPVADGKKKDLFASVPLRKHTADYPNFIDDQKLHSLLGLAHDPGAFDEVLAKSLAKEPLSIEETAVLLSASEPEQQEAIFSTARQLKRDVYGNRIVLFAPLYIGNECINDCTYCGFRRSNTQAVRRTLTEGDIHHQVEALIGVGHKRLILVFGEHPDYTPEFIARSVEQVYATKSGHGEIRRVNINAAPLDHEGYRTVLEAGIGTYQVFQETYHRPTYEKAHPCGPKSSYDWRLHALTRAWEAGCDDVGIGALFGLYDWRYEVLGMVAHARYLMERFHCGPHTLSFPRLRPASGVQRDPRYLVSDDDFKRLIAILRLAVPYTGMILTAREPEEVRRSVLDFGVSQIDAGSRIELGGYTEAGDAQQQVREREQFELGDVRSLDAVCRQLLDDGHIPSFCTACYRLGRTGEEFMEFAIPGFIERLCTPNALCTLQEYLTDFASPETQAAGLRCIEREIGSVPAGSRRTKTLERLERIRTTDERDLFF